MKTLGGVGGIKDMPRLGPIEPKWNSIHQEILLHEG